MQLGTLPTNAKPLDVTAGDRCCCLLGWRVGQAIDKAIPEERLDRLPGSPASEVNLKSSPAISVRP